MRISDWSSDVCSSDLDGQIYLPRGPVIGGENAFGTQGRAKARRSVGEDEFARIGILPQEVVARDDIFLVRQVLAVEADRPFVVVGGPDDAGVTERVAGLVEHRCRQIELDRKSTRLNYSH